jgi:hypothetical protein
MYGILGFFLGNRKAYRGSNGDMVNEGAHDEAAKKTATEGKWRAETVMRKDNLLMYMLRLLLEQARLCSGDREKPNYVDDLGDDASSRALLPMRVLRGRLHMGLAVRTELRTCRNSLTSVFAHINMLYPYA